MRNERRGTHGTLWLLGTLLVGLAGALCGGDWSAHPTAREAWAAEISRRSAVVGAVGNEDHTPGPIRLTADLLKEPAEAVKKGVDRLTQAVTPAPSTEPADDPTSLRTKAKVSPELYIAAAQVHESAGRLAQAEAAFQQAFRLAPRHLPTHLAYARFKDRQQQSREALEIYLRLSREYPNEATVFNDLGLFYARRGMNREAIAAFERAVQLQPKRPLYRNNLAVVLVQSDAVEPAMAQLLSVYTEPEACYKLGYLLQKKGDRELALEYFGRAVQLNPGMVEARQWYDHLRRQLAREAPFGQALAGGRDSLPAPPADSQMLRTAQRPSPPPADVALPPSGGQPSAEAQTVGSGAGFLDASHSAAPPTGGASVRQLPPMPKRLPPAQPEDALGADDSPPVPPPGKVRGERPDSSGAQPSARTDLPDAPLPPVSRAVRRPAVPANGVRRVPPVAE